MDQPMLTDRFRPNGLANKRRKALEADEDEYQRMSRAHNPYGDGRACERILSALKNNQVTL